MFNFEFRGFTLQAGFMALKERNVDIIRAILYIASGFERCTAGSVDERDRVIYNLLWCALQDTLPDRTVRQITRRMCVIAPLRGLASRELILSTTTWTELLRTTCLQT